MTDRIKMLMTQEPAENMSETKSTFEKYGISADFCIKDGEEVITRVLSDKPDVVIMDLFMTHVDSIGVMRAVRKQKPEKLPLFVVYSGFDSPVLEREVMSAGATYFVLKPFNLGDLAENIVRLCKRQRQKPKGGIRTAGFDGYNIELKVTEILHQIGVPAHIKGYHYLRDSIIMAVEKPEILGVIEHYSHLADFVSIVPISAKTGDGVEILRQELYRLCEEGPALYEEGIFSDQSERVMAAEFIREKLLRLLDREVPHGIAVEIEKFDESNEAFTEIGAVIYCEKDSHKGIVIGKNGAMLKKVGQYAREDMEELLGKKVFLTLWVKIRENWRDDGYSIRDFGYE